MTTSRVWSLSSVLKVASVICRGVKLTSRSPTDDGGVGSILMVPSAGFCAPFVAYETAPYATIRFWPSQLAICG